MKKNICQVFIFSFSINSSNLEIYISNLKSSLINKKYIQSNILIKFLLISY